MEQRQSLARRSFAILAGSALLAAAGCGDDDTSSDTSAAPVTSGPVTTAPATAAVTTTPTATTAPTATSELPATTEPTDTEPDTTEPDTTGAAGEPVIDPGDGGNYEPDIQVSDFVEGIDNQYLPYTPGSRWVYEGESDGEQERIVIRVTPRRKRVMGVDVTVVRDSAYVEGELVEDTFDWFAQDKEGNVWYLGEDTAEYEDGEVVSREGSWEAGVDGALPGIVMPASAEPGMAYRQEYYEGEAEDMGEVISVGDTVKVPTGSFDNVVTTRDWTPLEPEVVEEKSYAPGVGTIRELHVAGGEGILELVKHTPGS